MKARLVLVVGGLISVALALGATAYFADFSFPTAPSPRRTLTPQSKPAPLEIGSYDILGRTLAKADVGKLLDTEDGRQQLSAGRGALAVTSELVGLGREAFYEETFGNEIFLTDVVGILDGPIHPGALLQAILALRGQPTTNLQIPLDEDWSIGGRTFRKGTWISTGLDVPKGSRMPLGMRVFVKEGRLRAGITCAACHATVDPASGLVVEGAPNADMNAGLLLAFASNSAAFFRQTDVNPMRLPPGRESYKTADGRAMALPDAQAVEDAVDEALLAWPPGNFDSTGDLRNNPSQIPTAYTFDAWPYGWSGFANIGWFHGLTTLNANVHGTNSDMTTGADGSQPLLGIPKDAYVALLLRRAANPRFRPGRDEPPGLFLARNDPTPGAPPLNWSVTMPGYPMGSPFVLDGLLPAKPGLPAGAQVNGLSAYQNTLAPPPHDGGDPDAIRRGAGVFVKAGCAGCHAGSRFTNHRVLPWREVGTQASRAKALAAFPRIFGPPLAYPVDTPVPLPPNARAIPVPMDLLPEEDRQRAYAMNDPEGGYKVPSLIGLAVSAPYLHDGGVAAAPGALSHEAAHVSIADRRGLGPMGTAYASAPADPENSLHLLLDRGLRKVLVDLNRSDTRLQRAQVDGSGHEFWVDREAGFEERDTEDLIAFLLSLDDDPAVLPALGSE